MHDIPENKSTHKNDIDCHMMKLSSALDVCAPLLEGKLAYLDYPVHENVGDLLIWMGAQEFFRRHGKKFLGQFSNDNMGRFARQLMEKCSTLCFHGGGNFGDIWPWFQRSREDIIQRFPHKRIIILPQSVHYNDLRELDYSCNILRKHPDLHIFLRDRSSFLLLHERGLTNLNLCPDMAHALWGKFSASEPTLDQPLYLLRRDKESSPLPPEIVLNRPQFVDWEDLLTGCIVPVYQIGIKINRADRRMANILPAYRIWNIVARMLITRAITLFAPHKTIVTNRLHAVILSTILNRDSIVIDNSYGKLSSYIHLWMKEIPSITFLRSSAIHQTPDE
jgi:pyruvyl transferase EpsO